MIGAIVNNIPEFLINLSPADKYIIKLTIHNIASETEMLERSSIDTDFIIQELFALELEEIIQKIFLFLDPTRFDGD